MRPLYIYILLGILFISSVAYRYLEYTQEKNFIVFAQLPCNSLIENCFVVEDSATFKKVSVSAKDAPHCVYEGDCENFSCDSMSECQITYCSNEILLDGESCVSNEE